MKYVIAVFLAVLSMQTFAKDPSKVFLKAGPVQMNMTDCSEIYPFVKTMVTGMLEVYNPKIAYEPDYTGDTMALDVLKDIHSWSDEQWNNETTQRRLKATLFVRKFMVVLLSDTQRYYDLGQRGNQLASNVADGMYMQCLINRKFINRVLYAR